MKYQADKCLCAGTHKHICIGDYVYHHIKSRGAGGTDDAFNLLPLCVGAHNEVHVKGLRTFAMTYRGVRAWLTDNQYIYNGATGKWFRPKNV